MLEKQGFPLDTFHAIVYTLIGRKQHREGLFIKTNQTLLFFYPPSQKTTGLPVDECANARYAPARCRPEAEADKRGEACPSIDGQAKTGNLMGPLVYPWGSITRFLFDVMMGSKSFFSQFSFTIKIKDKDDDHRRNIGQERPDVW